MKQNYKNSKQRNRKNDRNSTVDDVRNRDVRSTNGTDRGTRRKDARTNNDGVGRSTNDPRWYVYSEQAALDNASLNFGTQSGQRMEWDMTSTNVEVYADVKHDTAFPGILSMYWMPSVGNTDAGTQAPINRAAFEFYTETRMRQKITYSYDAPDLMKYTIYMGSLYALYAHLNRIYGLVNLYIKENHYLPDAILHTLGVDTQDLKKHIYDFRAWLNNSAYYLSKYSLPGDINLFARWITTMSNVYTDAASVKSQMYVHTPVYFWQYDEVSGNLTPKYWLSFNSDYSDYSKLMSFSDIVEYWDSITAGLFNNGDFNNMSANVALAYSGRLVSIPAVDPNYMVLPVKDDMMLLQIQNSRAFGEQSSPSITTNHDTNALVNNSVNYSISDKWCPGPGATWTQLFNTTAMATGPLFVMEGMANFAMAEQEVAYPTTDSAGFGLVVKDSGPDVFAAYKIWYYDEVDGEWVLSSTVPFTSCIGYSNNSTPNNAAYVNNIATKLSQFDWHPIVRMSVYEIKPTQGVIAVNSTGLISDIDNFTQIDKSTSRQIHDVMMISLFRIPESQG